jgi:hypothetical protein
MDIVVGTIRLAGHGHAWVEVVTLSVRIIDLLQPKDSDTGPVTST